MSKSSSRRQHSEYSALATPWTVLLNADSMQSAALERLLTIYREPVLNFYRSQHLTASDAEDLTQHLLMDFFLVRGSHKLADRAQGRFRTYLLTAARYALLDWKKSTKSIKRGGRVKHVTLNAPVTVEEPAVRARAGRNPDEDFDRNWALASWNAAYAQFRSSASSQLVQAFDLYYAESEKTSQERMAADLGISLSAFNSRVFNARKRFFECIKDVVRATVEEPDELKEELDYLFELLSRYGFTRSE